MLTRRTAFALAAYGAMLPLNRISYAQSSDEADISTQIRNWGKDPANEDYFTVPAIGGRGSKRLPFDDGRVLQAAKYLAGSPKSGAAIEVAKYLLKAVPEDYKMEWPRDKPNNPQPANPMIVAFFAATKTHPVDGDQTAWCAAFMCWTLNRVGKKHPGSAGSRAFRSFYPRVETPEIGDLAVFKSNRDPVHGHVTFFDGWANGPETEFWALGGNQTDKLNRQKFATNSKALSLVDFYRVP